MAVGSENGQPTLRDGATPLPVPLSPLDPDICYRALVARDRRFDGAFFTGVHTTGIYCRPVCPARTPARERCAFYGRAAEAEQAGFRACFRCRPELSPGLAPSDAVPRLVRAATAQIDAGALNERSVDALAEGLGVTARHLRRAMETELGVSPIAYAQSRRLALAKQLLHDTKLPHSVVALAAGFASVRRFNALFRSRFGCPPSRLRRAGEKREATDSMTLRLEYRPPFDWRAMLEFLRGRAIPGVEQVDAGAYVRTVLLGDLAGTVKVVHAPGHATALIAIVSLSLAPKLPVIVARLRALFDLDAEPEIIDEHLLQDARLRPLVAQRPGLRVPGAFDPFEMGVRAILGQQVSVRAATTLAGRLVQRFAPTALPHRESLHFPSALTLSGIAAESIQEIGLPAARARTIVALARTVVEGRVDLSSSADPEATIDALLGVPGIGPWTAHYVALRALRWPDAFPAGDLCVQKALNVSTARGAEDRARPWRPWRAYGVMHLWSSP